MGDRPDDAVQASPLEVRSRPGEVGERLIRRFTRAVKDDGVLREFQQRASFVKPSVVRRREELRSRHLRTTVRPAEK